MKNENAAKVEVAAEAIRGLNEIELVALVCNLTGLTMQKINLIYHIPLANSYELIDKGELLNEAMKGEY